MQVMLGATIGIARPTAVTWLNSDLFTVFLGFLMLSMGLTLTVEDFKKARRCWMPRRSCLATYSVSENIEVTVIKS